MLTCALWLSPALTAICVAAPAVALAVNVTGLPVSPEEVAASVLLFVPAVVPSVHEVTVAMPLAFVVALPPVTPPPPEPTANVTLTPLFGLLN